MINCNFWHCAPSDIVCRCGWCFSDLNEDPAMVLQANQSGKAMALACGSGALCSVRYCCQECKQKHCVEHCHHVLCATAGEATRDFLALIRAPTGATGQALSHVVEAASAWMVLLLAGKVALDTCPGVGQGMGGYIAPQLVEEARTALLGALISEGISRMNSGGTPEKQNELVLEATRICIGSAREGTPPLFDHIVVAMGRALMPVTVESPVATYVRGLQCSMPVSGRAALATRFDALCRRAVASIEAGAHRSHATYEPHPVSTGALEDSVSRLPRYDERSAELKLARLAEASTNGGARFGKSLDIPGALYVLVLPSATLTPSSLGHSCAPTHHVHVQVTPGRDWPLSAELRPTFDYDLTEGNIERATINRLALSAEAFSEESLFTAEDGGGVLCQLPLSASSRTRRSARLQQRGLLGDGISCGCVRCTMEGEGVGGGGVGGQQQRQSHGSVELTSLAFSYLRSDDLRNAEAVLRKAILSFNEDNLRVSPQSLLPGLCVHALGACIMSRALASRDGSGASAADRKKRLHRHTLKQGVEGHPLDWRRAFFAWAQSSSWSSKTICTELKAIHAKFAAYNGLFDQDSASLHKFTEAHMERDEICRRAAERKAEKNKEEHEEEGEEEIVGESSSTLAALRLSLTHVTGDKPTTGTHKVDIFLSTAPILSADDCAHMIAAAEEHVCTSDGWSTSRHYAVPTTDIPVHTVPTILAPFMRHLKDSIRPLLARWFPADFDGYMGNIAVIDCFLVKYSGVEAVNPPLHRPRTKRSREDESRGDEKKGTKRESALSPTTAMPQSYLPVHSDQSTHSLIIPLNPHHEYRGGGTCFVDSNTIVRPPLGHLLAFPGGLYHGGEPVTAGTRYILAAFLLLRRTDCTHLPPLPDAPQRELRLANVLSAAPSYGAADPSPTDAGAHAHADANAGGFSFSFGL